MSEKRRSWAFVVIQAVLLFLLVFVSERQVMTSGWLYVLGRCIELVGAIMLLKAIFDLRRALTVLPTPIKNGRMQAHGLYKYVRHPMYSAVVLFSLGVVLVSGSWFKLLVLIGLVVLFYFKARYEEQLLVRRYPSYSDYMKATPRFIPKLF